MNRRLNKLAQPIISLAVSMGSFGSLAGCLSDIFWRFCATTSSQSNCPSQMFKLSWQAMVLSWSRSWSQLGSSSNWRLRMQTSISWICGGNPAQSTLMGMDSFLSMILSYFSLLSRALRFCQGRLPFRKQMRTQMKLSRSSLLDCSMPMWVLMETQRAVPVRVLLSRQGVCWPLLFLNFLERPKSIMQTRLELPRQPIRKLSGLMSRCSVSRECTYRMSSSIWMPTISVVFTENFFSQRLNRSSREGPSSSRTITLQLSSDEQQYSLGMATSWEPLHSEVMTRDSTSSWRRVEDSGSFLMATSTSVLTLSPMKISPKAPSPSFRRILQVPLMRSAGRGAWGATSICAVYNIMFDPHSQETEQYVEELKSGSNNMLVAVRCRPLNSRELALSDFETVKILNSKLVVLLDPGNEFEPEDIFRKNRNKEMQYAFDFAFDKFADNSTVYDDTVAFLIEGVIDGFNATVFAYGATGCGKTYTMVGTAEKPGIMPKCMADLFSKVDSQSYSKEIVVKVSYLEIYNENIKDLLISEDRNFDLREDPKLGVVIAGITEVPVHNIMEINALLKVGNRNRTKEATGANDTSSRSHGILQVTVDAKEKNQGFSTEIKTSKLSLVDLAGSERASNTTNRGIRMVEGAKINQSLLVLGNCIQALSEATEKGLKKAFVPYRGSKMTRLLKDSLGGNCRTVMIANVSPAVSSFEDTYNTLIYANRAKSIKTNAQRNVLSVDNHIANYANIISNLRKENEDLKMLLNKNQNEMNKISLPSLGNNQPAIIANLETQITSHYQQEMNLMKKSFENDEQVDNIGFQIFKLMIKQDKEKEALKDGVPSTKQSKDGGSTELKDKIETNKALVQSFFLKKEECLKELREKVEKRDKLLNEVKSSELTQANQNYLFTLIKQQQIAVEKQEVIYKQRKIQNQSKQKEILISYLKNQVSLRDKIIEQQKLLIQKNKIISRITYSKLKDLTEISNEAKLAFPQINDRGRAQSLKREPPRHLERARSIDRIDYDFVESPRRRPSDNHGNSLSNKKAYYNYQVEHEMKKRQLKSDNSVDNLSEKNLSKRKKKISYMYPQKLKDESESDRKEVEQRVKAVERVRSKDRLERSPEPSPNPLFMKKKPKYQASPNPQKHDNLNVMMIQR